MFEYSKVALILKFIIFQADFRNYSDTICKNVDFEII